MHPDVLEAMLPFFREHFGNPSSAHGFGARAREAVEAAREPVASLIGAAAREIVFTAGGTEASNLAIRGAALARPRRNRILISVLEHPATEGACAALERDGFATTRVASGADGRVAVEELDRALGDDVGVVSVLHANGEL